jgi:hypothetical protein
MGCDIHLLVEKKDKEGNFSVISVAVPQMDNRYYDMFRLFGVHYRGNKSIPQIASDRGIPADASVTYRRECEYWEGDAHSHNWLTVDELLFFDYDQLIEYDFKHEKLRDVLSEGFFRDIKTLQDSGADRIVFFFDN